jgi:hypothetical protein
MFEGREGDAEEEADKLPIPIHAFDFIVADECTAATRAARCQCGATRSSTSTRSKSA